LEGCQFYVDYSMKNFILDDSFEVVIGSFLKDEIGLSNDFLGTVLSKQLQGNLLQLLLEKQLKAAGIGQKESFVENKLIRNDLIYWLDRKHNDVHENTFFDFMDRFVQYLNETCYTGITSYEFHYAYYDKGSFYKKHLDQFKGNNSRVYSMIMYLNEDWQPSDGGELCVYPFGKTQTITPLNGKCVFFKSDQLEHEVLLSHQPRMSITGWLKSDA
jgi:SM-20-related protein